MVEVEFTKINGQMAVADLILSPILDAHGTL